MRISDWSSDVCSSDLNLFDVSCSCVPRPRTSTFWLDCSRRVRHRGSRVVACRPNSSFKPNALRYTNNMEEQLAMLLAPLRTSAELKRQTSYANSLPSDQNSNRHLGRSEECRVRK